MDREELWKAWSGTGVPQVTMKLKEDLYTGTSRVRLGKDISGSFFTPSDVRQGCTLYHGSVLTCNQLNNGTYCMYGWRRLRVGEGFFTDLDYADDVVLLVEETGML